MDDNEILQHIDELALWAELHSNEELVMVREAISIALLRYKPRIDTNEVYSAFKSRKEAVDQEIEKRGGLPRRLISCVPVNGIDINAPHLWTLTDFSVPPATTETAATSCSIGFHFDLSGLPSVAANVREVDGTKIVYQHTEARLNPENEETRHSRKRKYVWNSLTVSNKASRKQSPNTAKITNLKVQHVLGECHLPTGRRVFLVELKGPVPEAALDCKWLDIGNVVQNVLTEERS